MGVGNILLITPVVSSFPPTYTTNSANNDIYLQRGDGGADQQRPLLGRVGESDTLIATRNNMALKLKSLSAQSAVTIGSRRSSNTSSLDL